MVDTVEAPVHTFETDFGSFEEAAKRLRTRNERLFDGWKAAGTSVIDVYSGVMDSLLDLQETLLDTQLEWTSAATRAQAMSLRQAQKTQMKLAREVLA
jgi:hypothetical protein